MKNLFKLTDAKIIITIVLFFVGALTAIGVSIPKPVKEIQYKNFVGIDAAGFKHGAGENSTIINH